MKLSHTEKEIAYDIAYILNLKKKKDTNEFIYKTETDSQTYDYQWGRARQRDG